MCEPVQNIDQYFVERNNVLFVPIENENYTENSLAIMNRGEVNDKLAKSITTLNRNVIEINSGIGGLSVALMDFYKTAKVYFYESNDVYQKILRNNLEKYKFPTIKYKIFDQFRSIPIDFKNSVIVINLHKDCRDSSIDYEKILQDNYQNIRNVIIVTNNKKDLKETISKYNCQIKEYEGNYLQFCKPIIEEKEEVDIENIPKTIPRYENNNFFKNPSSWKEELRKFIKKTLSIITNNEIILDKMTSDEAMVIWIRAFTSDLWDPNPENNYQILEYFGDYVMKLTFNDFLLKENPDLSESQATSLLRTYVSKIVQGSISNKLGFPRYIRSPIEVSTSVAEDILESFFGGLMSIADKVFRQGMGYGLAYNFVTYIYTEIEPIDISRGIDPNKTLVKNIFNRLEWSSDPKDYESFENIGDKWTFMLTWPLKARNFLKTKNITSDVLVVVRDFRTQKAAESSAYSEAISILNNLGITTEFSIKEQEKRRQKGQNQFARLYRQALDKAATQGYIELDFKFPTPSSNKKDSKRYIYMSGQDSEGKSNSMLILPIDNSIKFNSKFERENYWKIYALGYYIKYNVHEFPR